MTEMARKIGTDLLLSGSSGTPRIVTVQQIPEGDGS